VNVIPAIDLLGGKAVRLREGRREDTTIYSDVPWDLARAYAADGARTLHVVDLDGAFAGERRQAPIIEKVIAAFDPGDQRDVQVGGGIRTIEDITALIGAGVSRVVIGTAAARSPKMVLRACELWPDRVIVAVDAVKGEVRLEGWTKPSNVDAVELALRAAVWGASRILYTDISRDGTKEGPNVEATARLQRLCGPETPVIASGGIGSIEDLRKLFRAGIQQCVIGRALYDGAFTLREAMHAVGMRRAD
jgi:phosphoribosylformimino-5-aminoimidazole carboxamide ribotide isomerase